MAHGGLAASYYCQTLDPTDIATTWTETLAVPNKAQALAASHNCCLMSMSELVIFPLILEEKEHRNAYFTVCSKTRSRGGGATQIAAIRREVASFVRLSQ